MNRIFRKRGSLAGTLFLCGGLAAGGAGAAVPMESETVTVTVRYQDLDLSTPQGAETLYKRISAAAKRACGPESPRNLMLYKIYRACYGQAIADAVDQVDSQTLTALHRGRTARPPAG